jgi:dephospho-CoA kinase
MVYIIGLTGNIACGKSQVAGILRELGAELIDADRVAHELLEPGTPEYGRIVERFGREILLPDGVIDRRKLGGIVFADPAALHDLEQILHPGVRPRIRARFAAAQAPVVVVEAIKLLEVGLYLETDAVWVVTADRETQIARLMESRGLTRSEAETRVDAQPPQRDKVARADVVIDNSGDLARTREQVASAWQTIESRAAPSRRGETR